MTPTIVTLLTDFGTADYFVGAMKGVILSRAPGVTLVDLTHEIPPQDVAAAAFVLGGAWREFPPGTVHLAVVDPGVGSERRAIAVAAAGHQFVGPDNGLFSAVLDHDPAARVVHLHRPEHFRHPVSTTFHGRDLFAPVAAALAAGAALEAVGSAIHDPVRADPVRNHRQPDGRVRGRVLHVDRFGNLITSFSPSDLRTPGAIRLQIGGSTIDTLRAHYAGAAAGEPFAIAGSAGYLEVSVNGGSAAALLGARAGDPVTLDG